ncbi:SH3 domain-containing protein [Streptomyces boluensis]|uniref:SH3 domain-containing protein n=1 Tax=Streptomyces boluensis TaxID=1775135 RepID=A0A964UUM8_9ACTN|nr:SH3 domain-containing protein [Streptomyces boluensis]NBE55729.1 SH3 domain-containing protein [Streptomyces boluensis]
MSEHVTIRGTDAGTTTSSGPSTDEGVAVTAATSRTYTVVADVNVRSGPGTSYAMVGRVLAGTRVTLHCQRPGETVTGPSGTSRIWDRIGTGRYISDTYLRTGSNGYVAPRC